MQIKSGNFPDLTSFFASKSGVFPDLTGKSCLKSVAIHVRGGDKDLAV